MKVRTKTTIEELTHEDLVKLLFTATYLSPWLDCYIEKVVKMDITNLIDPNDCREDVWAKALLAGRPIVCVDGYADSRVYGENEDKLKRIDDDGNVEYRITLKDIKKGLARCADGSYNHPFSKWDGEEVAWVSECFRNLLYDDGTLDLTKAEALMQVIIFNEIIYG